jgi:hypothetical protein
MSVLGQNAKYPLRAKCFRYAPYINGHQPGTNVMSEKCQQNRKRQALFDHLVRAGEKGRRDFDAERFCRLEINDKQEFGGLENPPWIGQHRERSDEAA